MTTQSRPLIKLIIILLAIPVIAIFAAGLIDWKLDSVLRQSLVEAFPDRAGDIQYVTASSICNRASLRSEMPEMCDMVDVAVYMRLGAEWAVAIALGLLGGIYIAGRAARRNRLLLLTLFAPGLHLTMFLLSGLIVLHAALAMTALYFTEALLIERVHSGILLSIGLAGLVGIASLIHAQYRSLHRAVSVEVGKSLAHTEYPQVWQFVGEVASSIGVQRPDDIVVGLRPNFYVTEASVVCLDGRLNGRTLYLSLPLCRTFSKDELRAVLLHEMAHFKGNDTKFSRYFYPIYRGAVQGLSNLTGGPTNGSVGAVVLVPAVLLLQYFIQSFAEAENEISRDRELRADNASVQFGGGNNLATALVKLSGYEHIWPMILQEMVNALRNGKQLINVSTLFETVALKSDIDFKSTLMESGPPHPTDSHPRVETRLVQLGVTKDEVTAMVTASREPHNAAIGLFGSVDALEQELTTAQHVLMLPKVKPH